MGAQGSTTIDFGAFPGAYDASAAVTGQASILSGSLVEVWIFPAATTDHTHDEHLIDPPRVIAGSIVAGTGFTIYGFADQFANIPTVPGMTGTSFKNNNAPKHFGKWTVAWVWN